MSDIRFKPKDFDYTSPLASPSGKTIVGKSLGGGGGSSSGGSVAPPTSEIPKPTFDFRKGTTTGTTFDFRGGTIVSQLRGGSGTSGAGGGGSLGGVSVASQIQKDIPATTQQSIISQSTVASQIQRQSVADVPFQGDDQFVRFGIIPASLSFSKKLFQRLASSPGTSRPSFEDIIKPIALTGKPETAKEVFINPITGESFSAERLTGLQKKQFEKAGFELTTKGELQRGISKKRKEEISSEQKIFQEKIDTGVLTLEQAQTQFNLKQEDIFKLSPDIKGISSKRTSLLSTAIETSLLFGGLTSTIAGAASLKSDPLKIDIGQLERGGTIESALTQKPSLKTSTFFLGTLLSGGGKLISSGRQLEQANIEQALKFAGESQKGIRLSEGGLSIDFTKGIGKTSDAFATTKQITISKLVDDKVLTFGKEDFLVVGKKTFSGKTFVVGGTRDLSSSIPIISTLEGTKATVGIGRVATRERFGFQGVVTKKGIVGEGRTFIDKPFDIDPIVSISRRRGDIIESVGGKISKADIEFIESGRIKLVEGIRIDAPIESRSLIKIIKKDKTKGIDIFKTSGSKTPFQTTFGKSEQISIVKIDPPKFISSKAPSITQSISSTDLINIPRSVGGGGLTQQELVMQSKTGLIQPSLISPKSSGDLIDTKINLGLGKVSSKLSDSFSTGLVSPIVSKSGLRTFTELALQTKLVQETLMQPLTTSVNKIAPFSPIEGFNFIPFAPINLLGGGGTRGRRKKRARSRVPIRPSFTGIVLGIEEAPFISPTFGVAPGQIRGLETGFKVPKKKKKKVKKKSKKKN